jgi:hypothetical protein
MPDAEFDLGASFKLAIGTGVDDIKKHLDSMRPRECQPILRPLLKSDSFTSGAAGVALGASGGAFLDLGSPAAGRIWRVTGVTVLGTDDHSTAANVTVSIYVGDPFTSTIGNCRVPGTAVPFLNTWNSRFMIVHDRENLFAIVNTSQAVTAQQIVVNALAWEYPDWAIDAQVI